MTLSQLYTRLNKITDEQKLKNFIQCCSSCKKFYITERYNLAQAARVRYKNLFGYYPFSLISEKCWKDLHYSKLPYNQKGESLEEPNKPINEKKVVKPKEPSKPVDFIDVLPKRKLRLD
jgi:hypothetical protein